MLEGFSVGDVLRPPAAQQLTQIRRQDATLVRGDFEGVAANVGRGDHIRQLEQRMIRARRFNGKHVHSRARQASVLERRDERRLINQGGARGVDQISISLHLCNLRGPEQRLGFVSYGRVQGEEIALDKELSQRYGLDIEKHRLFERKEWCMCYTARAKGLKASGHALPDGPKTDDTYRLMPQLVPL